MCSRRISCNSKKTLKFISTKFSDANSTIKYVKALKAKTQKASENKAAISFIEASLVTFTESLVISMLSEQDSDASSSISKLLEQRKRADFTEKSLENS